MAFLDCLYSYLFGWEVEIIWGEMFIQGFGFVVDYLVEVLWYMCILDYLDVYNVYFKLDDIIIICDKVVI